VCPKHGGAAPQVIAAGERRRLRAEAAAELESFGFAVETTPLEALEAMLWEAAGNVVFLRGMVAELDPDETYAEIYGPTGRPTGEAKPHVIVVMYDAERDRLAKLAEACAKLGLDERRVRLAEGQAKELFDSVTRALSVIPAEFRTSFREALANDLRSRHALVAS